jgi:hypothetical protein
MVEFEAFPKMARLAREIIVTEKIDGTNAQVFIRRLPANEIMPTETPIVAVVGDLLLYAGSRSRWIVPGDDNFGFAAWVRDNAEGLAGLGEGRHFGEWWGSGIQRGYGLPKGEKRFSLFNVSRWADQATRPSCCQVVPIFYRGPFDLARVEEILQRLAERGSCAAPGFMKPEGVIVFHVAGNVGFKRTIEKDDEPKSLSAKAA